LVSLVYLEKNNSRCLYIGAVKAEAKVTEDSSQESKAEEAKTEETKSSSANGDQTKEETSSSGQAQDGIIKRRSRWQSSLAALRYVDSITKDDKVGLRDSDKATTLALVVVSIFAFLSLIVPTLEEHRLPLVFAADVLMGTALTMYVANRFGIVTTLTPRQALLVWHLMLGSSLLGIFMAINLALLIGYIIANTHIIVPQ
jgi:hypothetical protein